MLVLYYNFFFVCACVYVYVCARQTHVKQYGHYIKNKIERKKSFADRINQITQWWI